MGFKEKLWVYNSVIFTSATITAMKLLQWEEFLLKQHVKCRSDRWGLWPYYENCHYYCLVKACRSSFKHTIHLCYNSFLSCTWARKGGLSASVCSVPSTFWEVDREGISNNSEVWVLCSDLPSLWKPLWTCYWCLVQLEPLQHQFYLCQQIHPQAQLMASCTKNQPYRPFPSVLS